ncbi:MAG TPA: hypothetical protein VH210_14975 [Gaiellaceae bacterium]|jgi:hypothetical protein|nr:hypothetical protein [Gaiellaceae bacterium]
MGTFKEIRFADAEAPSGLQMLTSRGDRIDIAFADGTDPAELLRQLITGMPPTEPELLRQPARAVRQGTAVTV